MRSPWHFLRSAISMVIIIEYLMMVIWLIGRLVLGVVFLLQAIAWMTSGLGIERRRESFRYKFTYLTSCNRKFASMLAITVSHSVSSSGKWKGWSCIKWTGTELIAVTQSWLANWSVYVVAGIYIWCILLQQFCGVVSPMRLPLRHICRHRMLVYS